MTIEGRFRLLFPWFGLLVLAACSSFEEKRIRELLVEKGFGTRAHGDARIENYVGGLDSVQFLMRPGLALQRGHERLVELSVEQPVAIDGTIFVPYVGPVYVLGKTELELAEIVEAHLRDYFTTDLQLQARIVRSQKFFYAVGEVRAKGPVPMSADLTLVDAMFRAGWTNFANLGRVYVIKPDAENPLVVDVNFREILTSGLTTANVPIRERDILYVPPTVLGLIARVFERLLEPVGLAVTTVFGIARIQQSYDYLRGDENALFFRY